MAHAKLTNVIVIGATGQIGEPIIRGLVRRKAEFSQIAALTRAASGDKASSKLGDLGVKIITADYSSHDSLVKAFKGFDAVIDATPASTPEATVVAFIEAAIAAGVKRYYPSEFGTDTVNVTSDVPLFDGKRKIQRRLEQEAKAGKITYTLFQNGVFGEWALTKGMLGIDIANKTARRIENNDNFKVSVTHRDNVGDFVAATLLNPSKSENKVVRIAGETRPFAELLKVVEDTVGSKFERKDVSLESFSTRSKEALEKKEFLQFAQAELGKALGQGKMDVSKAAELSNSDYPEVKVITWKEIVEQVVNNTKKQ